MGANLWLIQRPPSTSTLVILLGKTINGRGHLTRFLYDNWNGSRLLLLLLNSILFPRLNQDFLITINCAPHRMDRHLIPKFMTIHLLIFN